MGSRISPTVIGRPGDTTIKNKRYLFPRIGTRGRRPRMARLLFRAFGRSWDSESDRELVDEVLGEAGKAIALGATRVMTEGDDGYRLDLTKEAELVLLDEAWVCGVTARVLQRSLRGLSPYDHLDGEQAPLKCERLSVPQPPLGSHYPRKESERLEAVRGWMETDERLREARARGVWSEFNDRVVEQVELLTAGEHSAQQSPRRLERLETQFKQRQLNVLSCSTTMEMGVNIGQLSAVGMNNAPPGPANFLQRAGRAGRRGMSHAVSITLCQNQPHGHAVFANPEWPFTTPVHVPRVALESEAIVRRHVHALLLGQFLLWQGEEAVRLTMGDFFLEPEGGEAPSERFGRWLLAESSDDARLVAGVEGLLAHTCLEGSRVRDLAAEAEVEIDQIAQRFRAEVEALERAQPKQATGTPKEEDKPFLRALELQMKRTVGEYLLKSLSQVGFLPVHGFPTDVLPFVHTTVELLAHEQAARQEQANDADRPSPRRRSYATRGLAVAVREYAPGASVVLDGMRYVSGGLTMHWKEPPRDHGGREVQEIRWKSRCDACGAVQDDRQRPEHCARCETLFEDPESGEARGTRHPYLRPSGFAVDIASSPDTDVANRLHIPVEPPEIDAAGPWRILPGGAGRCRHDREGKVFHGSRGLHRRGFVVCLECGWADSMTADGQAPERAEDHRRLRRGAKGEVRCPGTENPFALKKGLILGGFRTTDVFELQLHDPVTGQAVNDETVLSSVAVALRRALAARIGVEDREIGWAVGRSQDDEGLRHRSVLLFDEADGGAGYVGLAVDALPELLRAAREVLDCSHACDRACHGCLLSFDTQRSMEELDRHAALAVLGPELEQALRLDPDLAVFGDLTRVELNRPEGRIRQQVRREPEASVRLYLAGAPEELEAWPQWADIAAWRSGGRAVAVEVAGATWRKLAPVDRRRMEDRLASQGVPLYEGPEEGARDHGLLRLATVGTAAGEWAWHADREEAVGLGAGWGRFGEGARFVVSECAGPLDGSETPAARPEAEAALVRVQLDSNLEVRSDELGRAWWERFRSADPALARLLDGAEPLLEVRYEDRYLCSPLSLHLVERVLDGLTRFPGGIAAETEVEVRTGDMHRSTRACTRVEHNFPDQGGRDGIARALFAGAEGLRASFVAVAKQNMAHRRTLLLRWPSGGRSIHLDEGLGFFRPVRRIDHDGFARTEAQLEALRGLGVPLRLPRGGSVAYCSAED